jgi:transposase InsO family protein
MLWLVTEPEIFNTDQGSQFTGEAFTGVLADNGIAISMDGKGAWRLFRQPGSLHPNRPDTVSHLASVRHTTVSMSNPTDRVEIITSVQRRRRWMK